MTLEFQMIFKTHGVKVTLTDTEIRCWKFTNDRLDFSVFTDEEEALDYIAKPFDRLMWKVELEC